MDNFMNYILNKIDNIINNNKIDKLFCIYDSNILMIHIDAKTKNINFQFLHDIIKDT